MVDRSKVLHDSLLSDFTRMTWTNNIQSYAADSLARNLLKKLEPTDDASGVRRKEKALKTFSDVNQAMEGVFTLFHQSDDVVNAIVSASQSLERMFPLSAQEMYSELYPCGYGNGTSVGTGDKALAEKLLGPLYYSTDTARNFFLRTHLDSVPMRSNTLRMMNNARAKLPKVTTVPKNDDTDRCICVETLANMYYQQSIRAMLESQLRRFYAIDLSTQPDKQRDLALRGSLDDRFSTIDLKSASDTIGWSFCRYFLPVGLFDLLNSARSTHATIDGKEVKLNMMSTMGNATTFPLQTLIFASLCRSTYQVLGLKAEFGVFGDDIIVVPAAYDLLCAVLVACGFSVNMEKSFKLGHFKESCGVDGYHGIDVRPVYIKNLSNKHDLYSAYNRLREWSKFHRVYIPETLKTLLKFIGAKPLYVSPLDPVTSGLWDITVRGKHKVLRFFPETRVISGKDEHLLTTLCVGGYLTQDQRGRFLTTLRTGTWKCVKTYSLAFSSKYIAFNCVLECYKPPFPYSGAERWVKPPHG